MGGWSFYWKKIGNLSFFPTDHGCSVMTIVLNTPPKINIEPENDGLEDDFPLPGVYSLVPC